MASMTLTSEINDTLPTCSPLSTGPSSFAVLEFEEWWSQFELETAAEAQHPTNELSPRLTSPDLLMNNVSALTVAQSVGLPVEDFPRDMQAATGGTSAEEPHPKESSPDRTRSNSPVADKDASTGEQSSKSVRDECPKIATAVAGDGACEPKSTIEVMNLFRTLRRKLQNGLLTEGQQPKEQDMEAMSLCLGQLEDVKTPPWPAIRDTRIITLLRKIKGAKNIPSDGNFHFTERASRLHDEFRAISEDERRAKLIDLTGLSDSEQSLEPTSDHHASGKTPRNRQKTARSDSGNRSSVGSENDDPKPRAESVQNSPKRKRSDSDEVLPADSSRVGGSSIAAPTNTSNRTSPRRSKKQKTSVGGYMGRENVWMKNSLKTINKLAELNKEEMKLGDKMKGLCEEEMNLGDKMKGLREEEMKLGDKMKGLCEEMEELRETMRALCEKKEAHFKEFKADLSDWMVEDEKVTDEWEGLE